MDNVVIAEEVALAELTKFIAYHCEEEVSEADVKEGYPEVLKSMMLDNLDISNINYNLSEINGNRIVLFKIRIKK